MNENIQTSEIATTPAIMQVDAINGLAVDKQHEIVTAFKPFADQFVEYEEKALSIVVTDASQKELIAAARESRLILQKIRTGADKVRKALKEDATRYNKAVQDIYNKIEKRIEAVEEHLETQEKFVELAEAKEREKRIASRMDKLKHFPQVTSEMVINLSDEMFDTFVRGLENEKRQQEEADRKRIEIEEQKKAVEKLTKERQNILLIEGIWPHLSEESKAVNFGELSEADWSDFYAVAKSVMMAYEAEQEKIRVENERLKAEKEEQEKKLVEIARMRTVRISQLSQTGYTHHSDVAELSQDEFDALLADKTAIYEAKEAERIALEKAKAEQEVRMAKRTEELRPYIVFIRDYNALLNSEEEHYQSELFDIKKGAELQWEEDRKAEAERKRLADELAFREEQEAKRLAEEERQRKIEEEKAKALALAPDREKLTAWLNGFTMPEFPSIEDEPIYNVAKTIEMKFKSFQQWAQSQIDNIK